MMIKYCLHCGTQFVTNRAVQKFCSDFCREEHRLKANKEEKSIPVIQQGCNLTLGEIANIMHKFDITYFPYACNRDYWITRYRYGD